ncbi:putative ribonuclease H-like domain-containing protein [Tanacetum coccineum]
MLIFSYAPLFLWAEAIATTCYTQNRSIIHRRFDKTPYELINERKPDISFFFHVFRALYYPKNDRADIGKLGAKGNIGFFIGYFANSYAYRVYNRRTKKIMKTMNVTFDELLAMAFEQRISKPGLQSMTFGQISSGLDLTYALSIITTQKPTEPPQVLQTLTDSTTTADITPTQTNSSSQATNIPTTSQDVDELVQQQQHVQQQDNQASLQPEIVADNVSNAMLDGNTFVNSFAPPSINVTKDHPLEQVIGEPSRPILIRNQLRTDGDMCMYALIMSIMEPRNVKEAMTDLAWIKSMQEELLQFKRLDVWVLVPALDNIKSLILKWLFKNKHDEENTVIRNKTRLVVRGIFLAYAAHKSFIVFQIDMKIDSLHDTLKEDVYVYQPEGFIDDDHPSHVYKLNKSLYGLKQALRAWYNKLSKFLLHNHFLKGTIDPMLFIRRFDGDILVV